MSNNNASNINLGIPASVTDHILKIVGDMQNCITGRSQTADEIDWLFSKSNSILYVVNNMTRTCNIDPDIASLVNDIRSQTIQLKNSHVDSNVKNAVIHIDVIQGRRGRPSYEIPLEMLDELLELSFSAADIARILRVSKRTVFRRFEKYGLSMRATYLTLIDKELDEKVADIIRKFPFTGYRRMIGFLRDEGENVQEKRVMESMRRVDFEGIMQRSTEARVIHRRKYSVRGTVYGLYHFVYISNRYIIDTVCLSPKFGHLMLNLGP